ncbi:hypothetical protein FISHEDRAFT_72344 [Fistulina hepatica ATCC 64428]|uniref:Xylanolytic transcriptional activator regulatory domain-containing protein n=1 Tax=Fistulina hepatica ATCC 64428 TaxID=1128425 RepID=A0A0D7AFT2_9AGAR|nr:hypothetical protein FISHEDRAFT_72344 [Fistulina hepatica ATCC 64428]
MSSPANLRLVLPMLAGNSRKQTSASSAARSVSKTSWRRPSTAGAKKVVPVVDDVHTVHKRMSCPLLIVSLSLCTACARDSAPTHILASTHSSHRPHPDFPPSSPPFFHNLPVQATMGDYGEPFDVKTEQSVSPDPSTPLSDPTASLRPIQFGRPSTSTGPSTIYRFGSDPPTPAPSFTPDSFAARFALPPPDDLDESLGQATNRLIRRRSSKGTSSPPFVPVCLPSDMLMIQISMRPVPCIMLGLECTFLGPSRKRGPPKGYIDAIEARLHQAEALLGIILAASEGISPDSQGGSGGGRDTRTGPYGRPEALEDKRDMRAFSLINDFRKDPLASDIIDRIDHSSYGVRGRGLGVHATTASSTVGKSKASTRSNTVSHQTSGAASPAGGEPLFASTHPSLEWQDSVLAIVMQSQQMMPHTGSGGDDGRRPDAATDRERRGSWSAFSPESRIAFSPNLMHGTSFSAYQSNSASASASEGSASPAPGNKRRKLNINEYERPTTLDERRNTLPYARLTDTQQSVRRNIRLMKLHAQDLRPIWQNARYGEAMHRVRFSGSNLSDFDGRQYARTPESPVSPTRDVLTSSLHVRPDPLARLSNATKPDVFRRHSADALLDANKSPTSAGSYDGVGNVLAALGELSLNEEEQVRYHSRASGLYLLGARDRFDRRNEGGIWRFPKGRLWPPLPANRLDFSRPQLRTEEELWSRVPTGQRLDHLLDLYFTHVQPSFPIIPKHAFLEACKQRETPPQSPGDRPSCARRPRQDHLLLLLAVCALAARYVDPIPPSRYGSPSSGIPEMWDAGDEYMADAKLALDLCYLNPRVATCQALLLLAYREVGLGSTTNAWIYSGTAIRMAQDLGMHRNADDWVRPGLGGQLFSDAELMERRRVWYGCVYMDKYVATYIGRPVAILERDFDTPLPNLDEQEEFEDAGLYSSMACGGQTNVPPVPGRILSCFVMAVTLSNIMSMIIQHIYAVRPGPVFQNEVMHLESLLEKWLSNLPPHLRREPGQPHQIVPLPHVLVLHMQYWCAVLLLHRLFIHADAKSPLSDTSTERSLEFCTTATNRITSLTALYMEHYPIQRCPVFMNCYLFSASVMHVTLLAMNPDDSQSRSGLVQCMDAFNKMEIMWPSAGRCYELLRGAKITVPAGPGSQTSKGRSQRTSPLTIDDIYRTNATDDSDFRSSFTGTGNPVYIGGDEAYSSPVLPTAPVTTAPNFERWSPSIAPFVSTSMLPQLYSTGLVDERGATASHATNRAQQSNVARLPYWQDYPPFPQQLGFEYSDSPLATNTDDTPQPTAQMYVPDQQYNAYNA